MKALSHRYATPLITGLFLVSTISGVALFFRWTPGLFHSMHEWLSMVLLVPFVLHSWKHWKAIVGYAKRKPLWVCLVLSLLAALPFAAQSLSGGNARGGNPAFVGTQLLTQARLADAAPVLHMSVEQLQARLQQRGLTVNGVDDTLASLGEAAGVPAVQLLVELSRPAGGGRH